MKKILSIALFAVFSGTTVASTSDEDVLFNLLRQEVNYYYSHLSQDSIPVSSLCFNVLDEKVLTLSSDMGYATEKENKSRTLFPTLKFGYKEKDGTPSMLLMWESYTRSNKYDLPLADDTTTIKNVIWTGLNELYQNTKEHLSKREKADSLPAPETLPVAEQYYEEPLPEYPVDKEKWKALLNRITLIQKDSIQSVCKAGYSCTQQRKYLLKSDGTAIVQNSRTFGIWLSVSIKDAKGVECPLYRDFFAYDESELPDEDELSRVVTDLIERADALSKAPMAEAYSGPVLFSGDAGGVFFHEVLGHRLEKEDSEFKPMMGKSVLPSDISVSSDPTINKIHDTALNGYYLYDEEGVKAQKVECIKDGIMKNFLHVIPQKKEDAPSNGHGRAAFGEVPMTRQSNLLVETSRPYTEEQLREMFVQQLKEDNKEYGYYIRTVSNGWTTTSNNTNRVSAFNVVPIETYRVYADGRPDSLVRGVSFIGTPLAAFSNIKAAGGKIEISNGRCGSRSGWIPVSITAPMIYVSQMETQCIKGKDMEPTLLPCPEYMQKQELSGMDADSVIFRAMEDEMQRSLDSLKNKDGMKPYFIDYAIRRHASWSVRSAFGTCLKLTSDGVKNSGVANVIVGDKMKISNRRSGYGTVDPFNLPDEISYNHIRRELWEMTDKSFKNEAKDYADDDTKRAQEFIDDSIPEWQELPPCVITEKSALDNWQKDTVVLKALADTLSAVFKKYPELIGPYVTTTLSYIDTYRLTSEGQRLRLPQKKVTVSARAYILPPKGKTYYQSTTQPAYDIDDLPPTDSLLAMVERFAQNAVSSAKLLSPKERDYAGPVLYENNAVSFALFDGDTYSPNINQYLKCVYSLRSRIYDKSYKKIGQKVISSNLSVWQLGNDSVFNGHRLFGYRKYDADGIRPATIQLIRDGVLVNQLSGRTPSPKSLKPTGNMYLRFPYRYNTEVTGFNNGVIRISANNTMSHKSLVKKLIQLARKQKLEYAYIIKEGWVTRVNTKTKKQEALRLRCYDKITRLELMGEIMASKENTANMETSVIYPKAILLPMGDLEFNENDSYESVDCKRFLQLKH